MFSIFPAEPFLKVLTQVFGGKPYFFNTKFKTQKYFDNSKKGWNSPSQYILTYNSLHIITIGLSNW